MTDDHPTRSELEHYLIWELRGPVRSARALDLENHVAGCEHCAERLAREARMELALAEIAAAPRPARPGRRWLAALAAAAILLVAVGASRLVGQSHPSRVPSEAVHSTPIDAGADLAVDSDVAIDGDIDSEFAQVR